MNRFQALDGMRGVAALAVALFHLPIASHLFATPLLREAYLCVDLFFVLSGFVIAHAYRDSLTSLEAGRSFVIRRFGRLWPLHVSVLAVLILLEAAKLFASGAMDGDMRPPFTGVTDPWAIVTNLLLVHAWGMHPDPTWNVPSWSISAELFAYLAFAAITLFARRWLTLLAGVIAVASLAALLVTSDTIDLTARLDILRATLGFFTGVVVYALFTGAPRPKLTPFAASFVELAVAAGVLFYIVSVQHGPLGLVAALVFAVPVYVFANEGGIVSSVLRLPAIQWLGKVSFSIYLSHGLVISGLSMAMRLVSRIVHLPLRAAAGDIAGLNPPPLAADWVIIDLGNPFANDLLTLLVVALVLLVSALTYRLIELPGQRLFAALAKRTASRSAGGRLVSATGA